MLTRDTSDGRRAYLSLGLVLLLILLAPVSESTTLRAASKESVGTPPDPLRGHGSRPAIRLPLMGSVGSNQTSSNWSGYVVPSSRGSVTEVNGSWIVPSVTCTPLDAYSSFWVGIDGWDSNTVEQVGTDSDCQGGIPVYYAWYEFYNAPSEFAANLAVLPGDVISASVKCEPSGRQCTVAIEDVTSGQSFSFVNSTLAVQLSSAEWIAEAPSTPSGRTLSLSEFGAAQFGEDFTGVSSSDFAEINGVSGPVGSFGASVVEVTMVSASPAQPKVLAQPSPLSRDGTSFSVARKSGGETTAPLSAGTITPVSPTIDVGQSVRLQANPSGGVLPYVIDWYEATGVDNCTASSEPLATSQVFSPSPVVSTYYCYAVEDSADPPSSGVSSTDLVTVLPTFSPAEVSASPSAVGLGQSAIVYTTLAFSGGVAPFTCSWLADPPSGTGYGPVAAPFTSGCAPSASLALDTGRLEAAGTWRFELLVTDGQGTNETSPPATVNVSAVTGPHVAVACTPDQLVIGSATRCVASVEGPGPGAATGSIAWSSSSAGAFTQTSCALLRGSCAVKFTPKAAGQYSGVLAVYEGASSSPSAAVDILSVAMKASETLVSCTMYKLSLDSKTVKCSAKVSGYFPTGAVDWTQLGSGSVSFSSQTCTLTQRACSVELTGARPGNLTLVASYEGDTNNAPSSSTKTLSVGKASTSVSITCSSDFVGVANPIRCKATVTGDSPTGTVTWARASGQGEVAFSSATCTLVSGSCEVGITAVTGGGLRIKAAYGGDAGNAASSATYPIRVV